MQIGVPNESYPGESRVAATPATVTKLIGFGYQVAIESGAGAGANYPDSDYEGAGAIIIEGTQALMESSDIVLKVRAPRSLDDDCHEADWLKAGSTLISFLWPGQNEALCEKLAAAGVNALAMDKVPRISRAQKMDALSSMANIAGYRAVLEASHAFGSFFTGQITAAGRLAPAKVLVIGAGVAGLQSIATSRALGAIVKAFDTREAVKEQVESLGGEFLEVDIEESGDGAGGYAKVMSEAYIAAEMDLFRDHAPETDIVITTALIPGRPAPKLWLADMVEKMKPGSVIVDLAAEQGGNCDLTVPGEAVTVHGVHVIGYTDLTSRLATTASQLYGTNLVHLLDDMTHEGTFGIDLNDEVVRGAIVAHEGAVIWPPPPPKEEPPAAKPEVKPKEVTTAPAETTPAVEAPVASSDASASEASGGWLGWTISAALAAFWVYLMVTGKGDGADASASNVFLQQVTVFLLACFVGWQVIWSVTAALHTPLMSVTNAISGIIIVGGLLHASAAASTESGNAEALLALAAVFFATINIAGGFLVTQRMLRMFRK